MTRIVWLAPLTLSVAIFGCSNQGEGDRCDLDNFSADCESGLTCKSLQSLTRAGVGAICCPEGIANVAACGRGSISFEEDEPVAEPMKTEDSGLTEPANSEEQTVDAAVVPTADPSVDSGAGSDSGI